MDKIDIIGLGEVVVDWVSKIPHFPKPDEKIDALSENYFSGGVTANYLVAVSRLGVNELAAMGFTFPAIMFVLSVALCRL